MSRDVVRWLESDDGQEWSRKRHQPKAAHGTGVFAELRGDDEAEQMCTGNQVRRGEAALDALVRTRSRRWRR